MSTAMKGPWFDVPAGTPAAQCRSCHKPVYWIITAGSKRMPVDCAVEGGARPGDGEQAGRGVSHFATCLQASQWRRRA